MIQNDVNQKLGRLKKFGEKYPSVLNKKDIETQINSFKGLL